MKVKSILSAVCFTIGVILAIANCPVEPLSWSFLLIMLFPAIGAAIMLWNIPMLGGRYDYMRQRDSDNLNSMAYYEQQQFLRNRGQNNK